MRCRRATQLIHLQADTRLSAAETRLLHQHLRACPRCRAYQLRLSTTLAALLADAEGLATQAYPSAAYHDALHQRLLEAERAMSARPLAAVDRIVLRVIQTTPSVPGPARRALATAVLFLALTLGCATHVFCPADLPVPECRLGHMPSLRMQVSANGRVYASLAAQSALSRRVLEERMP